MQPLKFSAEIEIIGVNPFVFVPEHILQAVFRAAGKDKGAIPICGKINTTPYKQTLVRFKGVWRLYINTTMLKNSPKRIGETILLTVAYDPEPRTIQTPEAFVAALNNNIQAKAKFDSLSPSRQNEIVRYLAGLKSEAALERNIIRAIRFLQGKERFVGRDNPDA